MLITALLLVLEVLCSIMLIGVILIQKSKGGGLSGSAFGGGGEAMFGARAGNVLTKITIGLSIFFLTNTLILAFIYADSGKESLMQSTPVSNGELIPVEPTAPLGDAIEAPAPPPAVEGTSPLVLEQPLAAPAVDVPVEEPVSEPTP